MGSVMAAALQAVLFNTQKLPSKSVLETEMREPTKRRDAPGDGDVPLVHVGDHQPLVLDALAFLLEEDVDDELVREGETAVVVRVVNGRRLERVVDRLQASGDQTRGFGQRRCDEEVKTEDVPRRPRRPTSSTRPSARSYSSRQTRSRSSCWP